MKDKDLKPLDPDAQRLIAVEQDCPSIPKAISERLLRVVEAHLVDDSLDVPVALDARPQSATSGPASSKK